ncbi:ExeM/NucH family extracellular endonuclease [Plantibacter sp. Mn2098]|uniref:ExeM/NucH family extracellular endonuclease n=1 Tax=Plantibacter sp. Mn2098 TaxID=3395266 RepID=UPI003BECD4C9
MSLSQQPKRIRRFARLTAFAALAGLVVAPLAALPAAAATDGSDVVINEVYASGGNNGAVYNRKFIELHNPSSAPVNVDGWSVQYRSASGAGATNNFVALTGTIPAGGFYLVAGAQGANGTALPAPDAIGNINPAAAAGTLALLRTTTPVTLPVGDSSANADVVDLVGYGTSNTFESSPAPAPSAAKSLVRTNFADTNVNGADFTLTDTLTPQNSSSPLELPSTTPEPTPTPTPTPTETSTPGDPTITAIADIQGTGDTSPLVGQTVTTNGFVTASFPEGGFNGYYLQTAGTGGALDLTTHVASDGIFIYSPKTVGQVAVGQYLQITGKVAEFYGLTQLTVDDTAAVKQLDATGVAAPIPAAVEFPDKNAQRESLEGMLLAPAGAYTVSDNYRTNQYGEITLAASDKPFLTPTVAGKPGTPAHQAEVDRVAKQKVVLDDGATTDFLKAANTGSPLPYISNTDPVRIGAAVTFTKPVVFDFRNDNWKFQPTQALTPANAADVQPATFADTRTAAPAEVGGDVKLGTFNVLNYFPTTGADRTGCTFYTDRAGKPTTVNKSDAAGCGVRGAADKVNFERQQAKIVEAINALGADVVSLEEIENSAKVGKDRDDALGKLVAALNVKAGAGTWSFVPSPSKLPAIGDEDLIRTGFIYKSAKVETVGETHILIGSKAFDNAREPDAQAFKPKGGTADTTFLVISNHFKSKSTGPTATGDNADTGQGAFTGDRTRQAKALVEFSTGLQKDLGTTKVFLVGDFNSYDAEDPIDVIRDAGYTSLEGATGKYTYAFNGAVGSLDHVFASADAKAVVTGSDVWNINSVESIALEYSRFNANVTDFYQPDAYRSSDHDPVVVGLGFQAKDATVNLLNINDFHGRIDANTNKFAGTVEQLKAQFGPDQTAFISAGDNIGASLFASSSQKDQPTIDVLNALGLKASAVGNHEFDQGYRDLVDRVVDGGKNAKFAYLGANVYEKGTKKPALPEYAIIDVDGLKVAVIGAVTGETPTLVSPGGIKDLEFGDPVEAVNRVAAALTDGDPSNGEADVIVAEYHDGAGAGTPDGATLEQEIAAGGSFADIVTKTSPAVAAIYTGHTHKQYAWDAPVPGEPGKTRPILQTGSYGEFIGQITLTVDRSTHEVTAYEAKNVARTKVDDATLIATYPAVAKVADIVKDALAKAAELGNKVVAKADADITRAFNNGEKDDRGSESTLGGLVADSLLASLSSSDRGGAEIGVVNPGGMREELKKGDITYAQANAVLPFLNNLWTTSLTGAQFKTVLEQQWQRDAKGEIPSRPYLQLGLSKNVQYTFDPTRAEGDRITGIQVNGQPIDPARSYRIGSFSFLLQGGDNFREFAKGAGTKDSGLVDSDAWISYLSEKSPVKPSFERRSVQVSGVPTAPITPGTTVTFDVAKLDLTSTGSPVNATLGIELNGKAVGTVPVTKGVATVSFTMPKAAAGAATIRVTGLESGTTAVVPVTVAELPAPTPVSDDALTPDLENKVTSPTDLIRGKSATVGAGADRAGSLVSVWLHSEPLLLSDGLVQVDAAGNVEVQVPADAPLGAHRLVVQAADGSVIGWQNVTVKDAVVTPGDGNGGNGGAGNGAGGNTGGKPGSGNLSSTGVEIWAGVGFAALLLAAGVATMLVRRSRQSAAAGASVSGSSVSGSAVSGPSIGDEGGTN